MHNEDTTLRLKLRRMRGTRGSSQRRDRVLAILHDAIAAKITRYVRVFRRGQKIIVFVSWVAGVGKRFSVRLVAPYSQSEVDTLIEALKRGCLSKHPAGVFVDLRLDGDAAETAMRIAVHLLWDRGCARCGLPSVVEKRRHGKIPLPFAIGVAGCEVWPRFLTAASPPSGVGSGGAAHRSRS